MTQKREKKNKVGKETEVGERVKKSYTEGI